MFFLNNFLFALAFVTVLYGLFRMAQHPQVLLDMIKGPVGIILTVMSGFVVLPVILAYAVIYPTVLLACLVLFLFGAAVRWGVTQES